MFRRVNHLQHLFRISQVLAKHDALFFMEGMAKPFVVKLAKSTTFKRSTEGRDGERLARALEELGPTFIKLGQALSTRADLVGDEVAKDLSSLQDRLPSFPFAEAKASIEEHLDDELDNLFSSFDEEPIAAASISQVHFAVTKGGDEVAVKVLRPGVRRAFRKEIDLFYGIAELADRFLPKFKRLKLIEVVEQFEKSTNVEMDLRLEAAAASELADNFKDDDSLKVPEVYWDLTAERILTTERISGICVDDVAAIEAAGHDLDEIMQKAANIFFYQVYRDGFFHADMHPGNLFINESGNFTVVDFGIMGRLDQQTRVFLAEMLVGFLNRDYYTVSDVHFRAGYIPADQDKHLFAQACRSIGEPIFGKPQGDISMAKVLAQMFKVTEEFQMETQPQLILLQKTMMLAEGIGRSLNPNTNFWELARPLMEQWSRDNLGPKAIAKKLAEEAQRTPARIQNVADALDYLPSMITKDGIKLHPDTLQAYMDAAKRPRNRINSWKIAFISAIVSLMVFSFLLAIKGL